jgi:CHAD domain-containing protein
MAKAKEIEGLDCHASAMTGIRLVLLTRLSEVCEFRAAALDWSSMSGVHDMRVASRRLRSVLRDFQPYLSEKVRQRRLRELARALGSVRDEDVAIAALEALIEEAPEEARAGLNEIIEERRRKREGAREALKGGIGETEVTALREKLAARVEQATQGRAGAAEGASDKGSGGKSFHDVGRELILKSLGEFLSLGASLYRPFEVEPLHQMRISAKRLRYALELFSACWGEALHAFAEEVAKMQGSLGDLHDADVWIEDFGQRLSRGAAEQSAPDSARIAAVWLLEHFMKERTRHYRHALTRWCEWEQTNFASRLKETLSEKAAKEKATESAEPEPTISSPS